MTRVTSRIVLFFLAAGIAAKCSGHGNPVVVNVVAGSFVVSGGLALSSGMARLGFDHDEGAYLRPLNLPSGSRLATQYPGFEIYGVEPDSQIMIEVLSRPDFTQIDAPNRWLWHWSQQTLQVTNAPESTKLLLDSQRGFTDVTLSQFAAPSPSSSMQLLAPQSSEIGSHQHAILYSFAASPPLEFGAYAFFARLTSPNYSASEPFLIALNHNLTSEEYDLASREINAAAFLPGDYDKNDVVDGADFLTWQRSFGSTTELAADGSLNKVVDADDLAMWKENFGRTWPASMSAAAVPEPSGFSLLACALLFVRRCKTGSGSFCH